MASYQRHRDTEPVCGSAEEVTPALVTGPRTDDPLGQDKYQAGPSAMLFRMGKKWVAGATVQHWWSYAGEDDRPETSQTEIQYVIVRRLPNASSVGMTPTASVNWEAESDDRTTLPIGLGVFKTVRSGKRPTKLKFEVQYSVSVQVGGTGDREA